MLLIQKLEYFPDLTTNEKVVAHYLLENQHRIQEITISEISKATFTSLSTTVRLAQKCGYQGWKKMKKALLDEIQYLKKEPELVDANYPFKKGDTIYKIAKNMASLLSESIMDTYRLLDHDQFQKVIQLIRDSQRICVYGITHPISVAYDFQLKMRTIGKQVVLAKDMDSYNYESYYVSKDTCSIFISYSGETIQLVDSLKRVKSKGCPVVVITSIGDNTFSRLVDAWLPICTKEKLDNKIATFSSNISIHYLLDLIFACIFEQNYDHYVQVKKELAEEFDFERFSTVALLNGQ